MIYTGIDGKKILSVEHSPLRKVWKITKKMGRRICVIPSDLCFVRVEPSFSKRISEVKSFYALDVEQRYGKVSWDVSMYGDQVFLGVYRGGFSKDCENVELEIFALARALSLLYKDGYLLDMGRRKTTLIRCEKGLLKSYRVILKGGDYINLLISQKRGIELSKAEELKIKEGLELEEALHGVKDILSSLGINQDSEPLLLSGGASSIKGLKELLPKAEKNPYCDPDLTSALGASLKFVLKNPYPDFVQRELSQRDLKIAGITVGAAAFLFVTSYALTGSLWSSEKLRDIQREEFKRIFPGTPIVSIYDQVRSRVSTEEPYELTKKFTELSRRLRQDVKIYSIEFSEGTLTIKGEGKEDVVSQMNPKRVKRTPTGNAEFELEIK
ncbi:cell division protein FtsA [Hydrogenobacter thermophilus]|uniref:cell division protein FtsA n=1 Tax=Hydrogenobacter thermophilus TaxID=940 RepID=UPI0030F94E27